MEKINVLVQRITESNLSKDDKNELIGILLNEKVDLNALLITVMRILQVSSTVLTLFDIDIGK